MVKKRDLNETANKIIDTYDKNNIESMFNMIAYEKGVCIEVLQKGILLSSLVLLTEVA